MDKMNLFKRELLKGLKYHFGKELGVRTLEFIKNEVNIYLNKKIKDLKHDNTVKPQHDFRKSKNSHTTKRVRQLP